MGVACSTYGGEVSCKQDFGEETWGERDHLEHLHVHGRIILIFIFKK